MTCSFAWPTPCDQHFPLLNLLLLRCKKDTTKPSGEGRNINAKK